MSTQVVGTIPSVKFSLLLRVWELLKAQGKVDGSLELGTFNAAAREHRVRWIHADDCCESMSEQVAFNSGVVATVRIFAEGSEPLLIL